MSLTMIAFALLTSRWPKTVSARARAAAKVGAAASVAAATLGGVVGPAWAGPPYVTDDPEPTPLGRWENYAYVQGTGVPGGVVGQTGLQFNYGGASDLQLSANLPVAFDGASGGRAGPGDIQLSAKYRFVHQDEHGWTPDIAIFPDVGIPTGRPGLGTGHVTVSLPIWVQKDFGKWSTFGGAAYTLNPGGANRNYTLVGWAVTRDVAANLQHRSGDLASDLADLGRQALHRRRLGRDLAAQPASGPDRLRAAPASRTRASTAGRFSSPPWNSTIERPRSLAFSAGGVRWSWAIWLRSNIGLEGHDHRDLQQRGLPGRPRTSTTSRAP